MIRLIWALAFAMLPFATFGQGERGLSNSWTRLPGDSVIHPAAGTKAGPVIVAGANGFLAVWSDSRSNPYGSSDYETASDIYALRLDSSGKPIDGVPFPIACERGAQKNPRIAWNGTDWLVAYETVVLDGNGAYYQSGIAAKRVTTAGEVLDRAPIMLYGLVPSGYGFEVASDGNQWVVMNQGGSATNDLVAMRISASGTVLDPPTRTLVPSTYYMRSNFRLAYAGGVFLLTFDDQYINGTNTTGAIRVDSNLNVLGSGIFTLHSTPLYGLSSNGAQFLIAFAYQRPDYYIEVRAKRVQPSGTTLDGAGLVLSPALWPGPQISGAWWDGSHYRVGWIDFVTPKVTRVSPTGSLTDPNGADVTGFTFGPSAGISGKLISIQAKTNINDVDIRIQGLSESANIGTSTTVSTSAPQQNRSDVAAGTLGFMVVYQSAVSGERRIMAQPVGPTGQPCTKLPITLAAGNLTAPRVAWNGQCYLVTWASADTIYYQRISASGQKLDASPRIAMTSAYGESDCAAACGNFLITARKNGYTPQYVVPVAVRVQGSDGTLIDGSPKLVGTSYLRTAPTVVELGGKWLVVYTANWTHDNSNASTAGTFVHQDGTVETTFGLHGIFSTAGGNGIFEIGVASNGNTAILVQPQELTSGVENDLLMRTIASNGVVGPIINLTPWAGNQYRAKAAWDGRYFTVVYQDQRARFSTWTLDPLDARSDLFGMRITESGGIVDPQGFALNPIAVAETDPNIASANFQSLVVTSQMVQCGTKSDGKDFRGNTEPIEYANYRIHTRLLGTLGNRWPRIIVSPEDAENVVPMTVLFNSNGTTDLDGTVRSYKWDFGDGSFSSAINPSHTYTNAGEYVAKLTVCDNLGEASTQIVKILARNPNLVPIAKGSQSALSGHAPLEVAFDAKGSYDPDGYLGNFTWTSGTTSYYGSQAWFTFSSPGTYSVQLQIVDDRGATATKTFMVNVIP